MACSLRPSSLTDFSVLLNRYFKRASAAALLVATAGLSNMTGAVLADLTVSEYSGSGRGRCGAACAVGTVAAVDVVAVLSDVFSPCRCGPERHRYRAPRRHVRINRSQITSRRRIRKII